jgi:nucleotide-binding universal stress UspA family protein
MGAVTQGIDPAMSLTPSSQRRSGHGADAFPVSAGSGRTDSGAWRDDGHCSKTKEPLVGTFRRILVGWDGSRDAQHALRVATHLAAEMGAEVVVLGVLKRHPHAEAPDDASEELAERSLEVVNEIEVSAKQAGLPSAARLRTETVEADNPAVALGPYASEHAFDLLVVGRHGLDRAMHPRVGGVTEHQVRHSPCPVLVVGEDRR